MGTSSVCCQLQEGLLRDVPPAVSPVLGPHILLWVPRCVQVVSESQGEDSSVNCGQVAEEKGAKATRTPIHHERGQHSPAPSLPDRLCPIFLNFHIPQFPYLSRRMLKVWIVSSPVLGSDLLSSSVKWSKTISILHASLWGLNGIIHEIV